MATTPHHLNLGRVLAVLAATAAALVFAAPAAGYGWPLKPFDRQHPVRGFFGDPRIHRDSHTLHFGVDISAPDGTPVYATASGRVTLRRADVVAIAGARSFEYWHVVPAVTDGSWATAYRTVVGHVEQGWGHVHLSELVDGRYVNPLRRGALGPYRDVTRPAARNLTVERDGTPMRGRRASGRVDLVVEASDETPLAVPAPWDAKPIAPAIVRWRLLGAGGPQLPWTTAADFSGLLPGAAFDDVYARWTRQNHPWSSGRYRFVLRHGWDTRTLADGAYRVEIVVVDTAGNSGRYVESLVIANRSSR